MPSLTDLIPWPYRIAAVALLIAAVAGFGWIKGAEHGRAEFDRYKAAEAAQTVILTKTLTQTVAKVEVQYRDRIKTIYEHGLTLKGNASDYLPPSVATLYLPRGFVRLRNAAATGNDPGPADQRDTADSGTNLAAAGQADIADLTALRACRAQVMEWADLYASVQRDVNGATPAWIGAMKADWAK